MAFLKLYKTKLQHNYSFLNTLFKERNIEWGIVTKILCGNTIYLKELLDLGVTEMHDSRISNLKKDKKTKSRDSNRIHKTSIKTKH